MHRQARAAQRPEKRPAGPDPGGHTTHHRKNPGFVLHKSVHEHGRKIGRGGQSVSWSLESHLKAWGSSQHLRRTGWRVRARDAGDNRDRRLEGGPDPQAWSSPCRHARPARSGADGPGYCEQEARVLPRPWGEALPGVHVVRSSMQLMKAKWRGWLFHPGWDSSWSGSPAEGKVGRRPI